MRPSEPWRRTSMRDTGSEFDRDHGHAPCKPTPGTTPCWWNIVHLPHFDPMPHHRMVEQRQIAERLRVQGNAAFKAKQYSEALRCYQLGLESERTNVALHTNAAQAALKISCYVQAIEHCDKVRRMCHWNNHSGPVHCPHCPAVSRDNIRCYGVSKHACCSLISIHMSVLSLSSVLNRHAAHHSLTHRRPHGSLPPSPLPAAALPRR